MFAGVLDEAFRQADGAALGARVGVHAVSVGKSARPPSARRGLVGLSSGSRRGEARPKMWTARSYSCLYGLSVHIEWRKTMSTSPRTPRVALVTGGSGGIGKAVV